MNVYECVWVCVNVCDLGGWGADGGLTHSQYAMGLVHTRLHALATR